jgi:hypothetical protein
MRAVNRVTFDASTHIKLAEEGEEMTEKKERKSYNLHLRLANSFDYKQFMGVRTLQHLCRCSIRESYPVHCSHECIETLKPFFPFI